MKLPHENSLRTSLQTDADKSTDVRNGLNSGRHNRKLSRKIEIVFPISSELVNFVVAKKYHWGVTETLVRFHWKKLIAVTEFLSCLKTASGGCWQANIWPLFKGSPQRFIIKLESAKSNCIFDSDAIQKQILSDISQCKYFSILEDEPTDIS